MPSQSVTREGGIRRLELDDGGYMIFSARSGNTHRLNPFCGKVLDLLEASDVSAKDIIGLLSGSSSDVESDVRSAIAQLQRFGLIGPSVR